MFNNNHYLLVVCIINFLIDFPLIEISIFNVFEIHKVVKDFFFFKVVNI